MRRWLRRHHNTAHTLSSPNPYSNPGGGADGKRATVFCMCARLACKHAAHRCQRAMILFCSLSKINICYFRQSNAWNSNSRSVDLDGGREVNVSLRFIMNDVDLRSWNAFGKSECCCRVISDGVHFWTQLKGKGKGYFVVNMMELNMFDPGPVTRTMLLGIKQWKISGHGIRKIGAHN